MAVTAAVKFTQGVTTDAAGRALIGALTTPVVASNGNNSNVVFWEWEVIDSPPGSAVPVGIVLSGSVASYTFVPDVRGGYHIKLTTRDLAGNTAVDFRVFQVLETTGRAIPPFNAVANALNFAGQLRGWAKYLEQYLHAIDNAGSGGAFVLADIADTSSLAAEIRNIYGEIDRIANPSTTTLPSTPGAGQIFMAKNLLGTDREHILDPGAATIDGVSGTRRFGQPKESLILAGDGSNWGVIYQSAEAGRWPLLYELDFTSLSLSTAAGNGAFAIDGKTWQVINFANSTVMSAGGADGLKIACSTANSAYSAAARTCPAFLLPITQIFPAFSMYGSLRVTAYNSFHNCDANAESVLFAVETNSLAQRWEFDKYHNGTSVRYFGRLLLNGVSVVSGDDTLSDVADNCYQIEIPRIGHSLSYERTGLYSAGFPPLMKPRIELGSAASPFFQSRMNSPSDVYLLLGASTGNTAGNLEVRFDRIRVEARNDL